MYAAVARTVKEQKVLVTDFTDIIFRKNSVRGVNLEEPLDYDKAMDVARSVLAKHGHSTIGNFFSTDPYSGGWRRKGTRRRSSGN